VEKQAHRHGGLQRESSVDQPGHDPTELCEEHKHMNFPTCRNPCAELCLQGLSVQVAIIRDEKSLMMFGEQGLKIR
jgi:hypothetical protein